MKKYNSKHKSIKESISSFASNAGPKIKDLMISEDSKLVKFLKAKFLKIVIVCCVIILILFVLFIFLIYKISPKVKQPPANETVKTLDADDLYDDLSMDKMFYTTASTTPATVTPSTAAPYSTNHYQMEKYLELLKNKVKNDTAIPAPIKHDIIKHVFDHLKAVLTNHTVQERSIPESEPAINNPQMNVTNTITSSENIIEKYVNISLNEVEKGLKYLDNTLNNLFSNLSTINFTSSPRYETTLADNVAEYNLSKIMFTSSSSLRNESTIPLSNLSTF